MATEGFPEVFTSADIDRLQRSWNEGYLAGLAAAAKPPDADRRVLVEQLCGIAERIGRVPVQGDDAATIRRAARLLAGREQ